MRKIILLLMVLVLPLSVRAAALLEPLKTDTPRDTMRSYMEAMNDYKKGLKTGDRHLLSRLDDAARCFHLDEVTLLNRMQIGRESAIFLKEVIDRVIVIDYEKIPEKNENPDEPLLRWRLKDTEITIIKVEKGERAGEYLFNAETAIRAKEFYEKVNHLPYLKGTTEGAGYRAPWLEKNMPSWTMKIFLGLAYWQWMGIFAAILIGMVMRMVVTAIAKIVDRLLHKIPTESDIQIIEVMSPPVALLATTGVWFASLYILQLEGKALHVISVALQILLFSALTWFFYRIVTLASPYIKKLVHRANNKIDDQLFQLVDRALKVMVIVLGVLLGLQNLGVQVFSLLAGLGIGGLAVALAAKDTLANFFGSIMIMFDRPFQVGHYIIAKGMDGTVEDIGFRSTKLRTPQHTVISIPNSEIAVSSVENFSLRKFRRVRTTLGIAYGTPSEKINAFIEGIKKIILDNDCTKKETDSIQVFFTEFGASSLNILVNFYISVPDLWMEMKEKQDIYLEIMNLAKKLNVSFAFPTQTLHIETFPEKK